MAPAALGRVTFRVAVAMYAAGLVLWLTVGLLPILVDDVPGFADAVGALAAGSGPLSRPAMMLLQPAVVMPGESGNGLLQYAFSLLNLVLGVLLIVRRPDALVPRLLALGLLGTAATFNLPSHQAFHILGSPWPIALLHFAFHIVSGVAYLWAVVLFPDGRLPNRIAVSERRLTGVAVALTAAVSLVCWWSDFLAHPQFFVIFFGIGIPVAGVAAQSLRLADGSGSADTARSARLLIGALLPAFALAVIWCLATGVAALGVPPGPAAGTVADRLADLFPLVFAIVPIVLFAGVLRYRLFDIDRLVSRVLVYGLIVIGSGVVYLIAVVTGGVLFGGAGWWTVIVLAAAAVALAPAWSLARRWANRVVFGQELDPQAALQALMSGLEQVAPAAELDQLVQVSVRATRAVGAQLWVLDDTGWTVRACAPAGRSPAATEPDLRPGRHWPVRHRDERLGVLTVQLDATETLPAADRLLLADLAAHAGLLVHNAVLAASLARRVQTLADRARQVAVSRRRMIAARDRERRRIERDLHDGAQQTLVAVMLGLRMAGVESTTPAARVSLLRQVIRELDVSRNDLSEIAGGQLPSAVVEGGLRGGLDRAADRVRRAGIGVELSVDLPVDPDLDPDLLGAVYFCCSEALQNVVKYARASRVGVDVRVAGGDLVFEIADDGIGIDPSAPPTGLGGIRGLDDRVSLHGGWIVVDSAPGRGTRLHGAVPVGGS